jgi:hypothetical protein
MEREPVTFTDEEWVSRIPGLPMERIAFLQENHGLVCGKEEFPGWFIENSALVLEEKSATSKPYSLPGNFGQNLPKRPFPDFLRASRLTWQLKHTTSVLSISSNNDWMEYPC